MFQQGYINLVGKKPQSNLLFICCLLNLKSLFLFQQGQPTTRKILETTCCLFLFTKLEVPLYVSTRSHVPKRKNSKQPFVYNMLFT